MAHFIYSNGRLMAEQVPLADIAATHGTPCYVYSRAAIEQHWHAYDQAFKGRGHLVCYSVKANGNLAVLNVLARLGSGFDIVSVGELERVLLAGGDAAKVVFSGVGKQDHEVRRALMAGIRCFNVESISELHHLDRIAGELNSRAPVALRVNPDIDPGTHPYIATGLNRSKFGIPYEQALDTYRLAQTLGNIEITGIDCHIGSQITQLSPYLDALKKLAALCHTLKSAGTPLRHIDVGGGMGISYRDEKTFAAPEFVHAVCSELADPDLEILIEPGRSIAGEAGVLLTRVLYLKGTPARNFAITDAAMNDLLRPALYDAWQRVLPLREQGSGSTQRYDLVGPVCESADFLALDRELDIVEGDLLALGSAGAYGFCMSSNYNARPRAAEVMVDREGFFQVRRRETIADLVSGESLLPR
jgi:diaminopimelate decarboxylase